jgi:hypothetical protein
MDPISGDKLIHQYEYCNCPDLKVAKVEDCVQSIGYCAFYNCINLHTVVLPAGLREIHPYAFDGCVALKTIIIPDGVTFIGQSAFRSCGSIKSICIPPSVRSMGILPFEDCSSLESLEISGKWTVHYSEHWNFLGLKAFASLKRIYNKTDSLIDVDARVHIGPGHLADTAENRNRFKWALAWHPSVKRWTRPDQARTFTRILAVANDSLPLELWFIVFSYIKC